MDRDKMLDEWNMWQRVVGFLRERGVEIDEAQELAGSIVLWGELLVALRVGQTDDMREAALQYALGKFNQAVAS